MHATTVSMAALGLAATSLAAPAPAIDEVAVEKRFKGGWCGVHVHIKQGQDNRFATVKVFDANQFQLAQKDFQVTVKNVIFGSISGNGLPQELHINVNPSNDSPASFEYGDQHWESGKSNTKNSRCSVGKWDNGGPWSTTSKLDMDCGFSC
ncbi:hypothetical protein PG989_004204 [Apiospora arundinis]